MMIRGAYEMYMALFQVKAGIIYITHNMEI